MTRSQIEEEYDPMSPLQISIDAMVAQLHELLNDADQTNDPNANVRVWAVREVLAAYLVTSDQIDGPIELWAEVARRSPDFTTAAAASVGEPLCTCGHPRIAHARQLRECYDWINLDLAPPCQSYRPSDAAYLPPRPVPEEPRPTILDDVDGDLDEIEQIAEARAQGYGYQPDTGSASRIQTHDDPYRNTRPATIPAPHAEAEAAWADVESIVAARVQALTAEVERLKRRPKHRDFELVELSRDAARAELAAANKAANDLQVVLTHAFEDIANVKADNAALSARLERVRALAAKVEATRTDDDRAEWYAAVHELTAAVLGEDA